MSWSESNMRMGIYNTDSRLYVNEPSVYALSNDFFFFTVCWPEKALFVGRVIQPQLTTHLLWQAVCQVYYFPTICSLHWKRLWTNPLMGKRSVYLPGQRTRSFPVPVDSEVYHEFNASLQSVHAAVFPIPPPL
jgi:hypothetical protein